MPYSLAVSNNSNNNNNNNDQSNISTSPGHYDQNKYMVKAQLPNQQRTTVSVPAGMTIREALSKALKLRKLEPDMCTVYRLYSPQCNTKQKIDWDVDVAMLQGDEIVVETKDRIPMHTQLSHNFVKSYLTLSKCHFCQEFLMTGIRCLTCGIEFHRNCAKSVPKLCEPAIEHSNYYRHLLARSSGFSPTNTYTCNSGSPTNTSKPIRPRARSADENSKHKSKSVSHAERVSIANSTNNNTNDSSSNNINKNVVVNGGASTTNSNVASAINHYYNNLPNDPTAQPSSHHYSNGASTLNKQHFQPQANPTNNQHSIHQNLISTANVKINTGHHQIPPPQRDRQQLSPSSQQQLSKHELFEEKWEIDGTEVTIGDRIGSGSFATVYKGNWHGPVALKKLNVEEPTPDQLQGFKNEVLVLKKTRHQNILLFLGYILKPDLMIVTQWCKGRSLYKHLHVEERKEFNNCEIQTVAEGIAQGMEYLHAKNILHRDLKSNNIFIHDEDNLTVKIGDFGLATFKTRCVGNEQIYQPTGSILWMAPEVINTKPGVDPFTFHSDVYSYGIVLYELLSRKLPYFDFPHKDALLYLIGSYNPARSPKLNLNVIGSDKPEFLKKLMLKCVLREPSKRPLFTSIIEKLKIIQISRIYKSTSEPLRLNDLNGSLALNTMNL